MYTTTDTEHLNLERVLATLRRRWLVIVAATVLTGAAAYAFSATQTKKYTATASVVFADQLLQQQAAGLQPTSASSVLTPEQMATNVALLSQQSGVTTATARIVGHGLTPGGVGQAVSVGQQGQTNVATVSATSDSPQLAAAIANTFVSQFIASQAAQQQAAVRQGLSLVQKQIDATSRQQLAGPNGQALEDRAESLRILAKLQDGGVQVVKSAKVPGSPSSPRVTRNTLLGLVLGLLLGLGLAFLLERLDRRMKDVEDLEATYQVPLLAAVPRRKAYGLPPRPGALDQRADAEVFKLLRAYLRYFNVDRELRVLVVASAVPGEGKTTIAHNLAEAAQETGTKTLLIEADLRRPTLAGLYGLPAGPGLSDQLIGSVGIGEAIRSMPLATRVNGATTEVALDVLLAGHPPPNPAELIASNSMTDLLSWASEHYELVIIDTPPISVVSDAISLLPKADGVVLVSQLGKSTRDAAAFLRDRLSGVNAPVLGVVANCVPTKGKDGFRYGYGYGEYEANANGASTELKSEPSVQ